MSPFEWSRALGSASPQAGQKAGTGNAEKQCAKVVVEQFIVPSAGPRQWGSHQSAPGVSTIGIEKWETAWYELFDSRRGVAQSAWGHEG